MQRKIFAVFFAVSNLIPIFAVSNHSFMKEKKDNASFEGCTEPVGAVTPHRDNEQLFGIDNWPGMPLVGPADINEANARIDQAEHEIDENGGMDWADFKSMLLSKHTSSYAI